MRKRERGQRNKETHRERERENSEEEFIQESDVDRETEIVRQRHRDK